jgi:hypothetical protein
MRTHRVQFKMFKLSIEEIGSRGTKWRKTLSYKEQLNGLGFLIIDFSFDNCYIFTLL